jgi:hypothetical protein
MSGFLYLGLASDDVFGDPDVRIGDVNSVLFNIVQARHSIHPWGGRTSATQL